MPAIRQTCQHASLHGNSRVRDRRRRSRHSKPMDPLNTFISEACLLPFNFTESHYNFVVTGNQEEKRFLPPRWSRHSPLKGSDLEAFYKIFIPRDFGQVQGAQALGLDDTQDPVLDIMCVVEVPVNGLQALTYGLFICRLCSAVGNKHTTLR